MQQGCTAFFNAVQEGFFHTGDIIEMGGAPEVDDQVCAGVGNAIAHDEVIEIFIRCSDRVSRGSARLQRRHKIQAFHLA